MFRVAWDPIALDELAAAWISADSAMRQAMTPAVQAIDRRLQTAPDQQGESRADNRRILFEPPLGVVFEIDRKARLVWVIHAWSYQLRDRP